MFPSLLSFVCLSDAHVKGKHALMQLHFQYCNTGHMRADRQYDLAVVLSLLSLDPLKSLYDTLFGYGLYPLDAILHIFVH